MQVQAFVANPPVEALGECVLHGFAGLDVLHVDSMACRPLQEVKAPELRSVVADQDLGASSFRDGLVEQLCHRDRAHRRASAAHHALSREVIDCGEDA